MSKKTELSFSLQFWEGGLGSYGERGGGKTTEPVFGIPFSPPSVATGEKALNALQHKLAGMGDRGSFCSHLAQ